MRSTLLVFWFAVSACGSIDSTGDAGEGEADAGSVTAAPDGGSGSFDGGLGVDAGPGADAGEAQPGRDGGPVDGGALARDAGTFTYRLETAVSYSTLSPLCQLDIAVPSGPGPFPAIVFIHGGGWAPTGRAAFAPEVRQFASQGYVALTIDYLGRAAGWREILKSVKTAVKWLRVNAATYHVDVDRVGVAGSSAGGHLASMLGTTGDDAELRPTEYPLVSDRVQAVVSMSGSYDLVVNWDQTDDPGYVRPILETVFGGSLGNTPQANPAGYHDGSPVNHVSADDAPFCLCHGTADLTSPWEQVAPMRSALEDAGVAVEAHVVEGAPHIWEGTEFAPVAQSTLSSCFERHLRGP